MPYDYDSNIGNRSRFDAIDCKFSGFCCIGIPSCIFCGSDTILPGIRLCFSPATGRFFQLQANSCGAGGSAEEINLTNIWYHRYAQKVYVLEDQVRKEFAMGVLDVEDMKRLCWAGQIPQHLRNL